MNISRGLEKLGYVNQTDFTVVNNGSGEVLTWLHSDSQPTMEEIKAQDDARISAYSALEYARKRAAEYPSIADQLDDIYHNGIDAWKATIKATKDKYPKP